MQTADATELCRSANDAVNQIRPILQGRTDTFQVLDRFWCLQDVLARLVQAVNDAPVVAQEYRGLIRRVIEVLSDAKDLHFTSIPAVAAASEAINLSLIELEHASEQMRAVHHVS